MPNKTLLELAFSLCFNIARGRKRNQPLLYTASCSRLPKKKRFFYSCSSICIYIGSILQNTPYFLFYHIQHFIIFYFLQRNIQLVCYNYTHQKEKLPCNFSPLSHPLNRRYASHFLTYVPTPCWHFFVYEIRERKYASINASISPSITACTFPISVFVR